jgi:hypothetical protein
MSAFKEQIQMYSVDQLQAMECEKLVELYNNGLSQLEEYSTKVINLRDNTTLIRQVICEKSNLKIEADDSDDDQIMTQENKKLPQKNQKVVKNSSNDTNNEIEQLATTSKSKVVKLTTDKPLAKTQLVKAPTKKTIVEPEEASDTKSDSDSESEEVIEVEPVKKVTTNNKTSAVKKVEETVKKVAPVKKTVAKAEEEQPVKKVAPVKKTVTKATTDEDDDEVKEQPIKKVVKKVVKAPTDDKVDDEQPVKKIVKKVTKVVNQDIDNVSIVGNELGNEKSQKKTPGQKKK